MSTEAVEASANFSQQDTAAHVADVFKNLPRDPVEAPVKDLPPIGTDLAEEIVKNPPKKEESKKNDTGLDIPDEILGIEKKEEKAQDEWEQLHNEEVKGQVKNENYKRYKEATGKKISALSDQMAALQKERDELKGKINPDFAPEKITKELEDLRGKLKEREDLIGKKYVQESREFREKFSEPQTQLVAQLKKAGDELGFENAQSLLGMSLKKRVEVLGDSELSVAAQSHLTQILQQHDALEAGKEGYLSQWESKRAEMDAQEQQMSTQHKAEMKKIEDETFNKVLDAMAAKFSPLKKIEGNEAWNSARDEDIRAAKAMFDGEFTTDQFAEIVLAGFGAKRLHGMFDKAIARVRELTATVNQLQAAEPGVNGQTGKINTERKSDTSRYNRADAHETFRQFVSAARENEVA